MYSTSPRRFLSGLTLSTCVAVVSSAALADDLQPPSWARFAGSTTFQAWGFPSFANPNANFVPPDEVFTGPFPPNYSNPFPQFLVTPNAERTMNTSYVGTFPPIIGNRHDLIDLSPAGPANNPPAGQLVFRGQTLRPQDHLHVDLVIQYTYSVGLFPLFFYDPPFTQQASDQVGNNFVLNALSEILTADGLINRREVYALDLPANAPVNHGTLFEIRTQTSGALHALVDQVIIDTRTAVPAPAALLACLVGGLVLSPAARRARRQRGERAARRPTSCRP